jgi:hypothetical protein
MVSDKTQHVDMWSFATIVSRSIPLESFGLAFSANQKRFQWTGSKVSSHFPLVVH